MSKFFKVLAASFALLSVLAVIAYSKKAPAKPLPSPTLDPEAVRLLRNMTGYMSSLKQFSVLVRNLREDMSDSGHRVDFEMSANLIVSRPNKLRVARVGYLVDQVFYYNGKTLTLYNPTDKVYATEPAAATIEEMLDFARDSLGIAMPVSDLVYRNGFPLLTQDLTLGVMVGKEIINGVKCDHLLFSKPGVDFQVWVTDADRPLPLKYIVTDTSTPELLSITTFMSDWNVAPAVADAQFTFMPPKGAKAVTFIPLNSGSER